jgi:hypothetical protein
MDQHVDISVCAHAACWSILRHYSESYNIYREFLTYDITTMAHEFDPGGLVPSKGLQMSHAERVFQEAGTYPVHIARAKTGMADLSFYRQLSAYVESKFPLFAAMHSRGHAVAVVGYEWRTPLNTGIPGMRYAWDEIQSLAVVDDNHLPYLSIPVNGGPPYSAEDLDAFIVALPEKVFYPADAVDRLAPALFKLGAVVGLPPQEKTIIRYFITSEHYAGADFFNTLVYDACRGEINGILQSHVDAELLETDDVLNSADTVWSDLPASG